MIRPAALLSAVTLSLSLLGGTADADEVRASVVKIFTSKSPPNMFRPWQIEPPSEVTGSGVIIDDNRILTNAHVVSWAQQIYVQPYESSDKLDATVEFISQECDLATLKLDNPEAIKELKAIPLADDLPGIKDKINVLGYPTGGDTLSVTEGVVSRIEFAAYNYRTGALRIQVDAAINPGNSGGPGIIDNTITGIVFSRFNSGDNIGYLIPAEVVRHFLADFEADGSYDGFPKVDLQGATLENPALRDYLELDKEQTGVVVHKVSQDNLEDLIQPWDVISGCDGVDIDNDGRVPVAPGIRTNWAYLLSRKPPGSKATLEVIRKAKALDIEIPTITTSNSLVQKMEGDRPSYFVYAGLVFSRVTTEMVYAIPSQYFAAYGAAGRLLVKRISQPREEPTDELVVTCTPILPHKLTKGYGISPLSVITHVNEVEIRNLRQMIEVIKNAQDEDYIIFRFEDEDEEKVVLKPAEVKEEQAEILRNNNIPHACSEDLRDLWP